MRTFLLVLTFAVNSFAASPIILGARGGVPLTNNSNGLNGLTPGFGLASASQRYVVGPTVGIRLPFGFSAEADALFNRQTLNFGQFGGFTAASTHADSWEFPMMLKFTAGHHAIAPVLGAGVSVRHLNNISNIPSFLLTGTTASNSVAFVAGGGLRFKVGPVDITPEVRYTRWTGNNLTQSLLDVFSLSRNQAQVLVGFTF